MVRATTEGFESLDCTREAATNEPLVRGQQLVAPVGAGISGRETCSKPAENCEADSLSAGPNRSFGFDVEWRALQQPWPPDDAVIEPQFVLELKRAASAVLIPAPWA